MCGIIDSNGDQWEHCTCCGKMCLMQNLGYLPAGKSKNWPQGADICIDCTNKLSQTDIYFVVPANGWIAKYGK